MGWRQSDLSRWFDTLPPAIQALLASAAHRRAITGDPSPPGPPCADAAGDPPPSPPPPPSERFGSVEAAAGAAGASGRTDAGSGPGGGDSDAVGVLEVHYDHGPALRTVLANARLAALLGIDAGEL